MNYKELNNVFKKINKWYSKKTKVLSIKTRPFNTINIFSNIINKVLCEHGTVLYVFCSKEEKYVNEKKKELYEFIRNEMCINNFDRRLMCTFIEDINNINNSYDLVIFDDISLFSKASNEYIRDYIENIYWKSERIIIYSSEFIFPIGEKIEVPYMISSNPIVEPRFINTRIRLEENIPLSLFEYFKWFRENNKRVLIVVPTEEKLNKVYNHYYGILKDLNIRVVRYSKKQNFKFINEIIAGYSNSLFIITNCCGQYINYISNLNIIILFADDLYYSYKKILYICSSVNSNSSVPAEVIMVSKEVSEEMDKAKEIMREFNKRLWEKQYQK